MIKLDNIEVMNFEAALRGMRNPLASWEQSDSISHYESGVTEFFVGEKDYELAIKLIKAGSDHSKFLRQIFVSMDITAPIYWWKEMDTYKISTVANSTSTMHKLGNRLLVEEDFSWDNDGESILLPLYRRNMLNDLNMDIKHYQQLTKDMEFDIAKIVWRRLVQDLPCAFNQMRTWTANYQNLRNIYHARKNHKLSEWKKFCKELEDLPYNEFITC